MGLKEMIEKLEQRLDDYVTKTEFDLRLKPIEELREQINKVIFSVIMIVITAAIYALLKLNNAI